MIANQFSAPYGHSSGGQFNQIIKSGTNQFHGDAVRVLYQNRNLNAADNLNRPSKENRSIPATTITALAETSAARSQKDKLFFFVDWEYNPVGQAGSAGLLFAPTAAGYSTLASIPGVSATNLSILQKYLPAATTAADPSATFSGAYPVVNGITIPVGQVSVPTPSYTNNEAGVASIDYTIWTKTPSVAASS